MEPKNGLFVYEFANRPYIVLAKVEQTSLVEVYVGFSISIRISE